MATNGEKYAMIPGSSFDMQEKMHDKTIYQGRLTKRAQMKHWYTSPKFQERDFKLTEFRLEYSDPTTGKLKSYVDVSAITLIEEVCHTAFTKPHVFQVWHESYVLYLVASNDSIRQQWIKHIANAARRNDILWNMYHPSIYDTNEKPSQWLCCSKKPKTAEGCQPAVHTPVNDSQPLQKSDTMNESVVDLSVNSVVFCKWSYNSTKNNELSIKKGDTVTVVASPTSHSNVEVRNLHGKVGLVPSACLQKIEKFDVESESYFLDIPRIEAERLLRQDERIGVYLVRKSRTENAYVISVNTQRADKMAVKHVKICSGKNELTNKLEYWVTTVPPKSSITELINYLGFNSAKIGARLKYPVSPDIENQVSPIATMPPTFSGAIIQPEDILLQNVIGQGNFALVYRGLYLKTIQVAVKELKSGVSVKDSEDFLEEAGILSSLEHKHIVRMYGICDHPLRIISEYCKNGDLRSYLIHNQRSLVKNVSTLIDFIIDVCSAMVYLESRPIIHRDLAARNVLVTEANKMKVADFGLSRLLVEDDIYNLSDGSKFPMKWAAPETLINKVFSSKSDVWSFGITCWEIFSCGEMPYENIKSRSELMQFLESGQRLPCPSICPESFYKLMLSCWEEDRSKRPRFSEISKELSEQDDYF